MLFNLKKNHSFVYFILHHHHHWMSQIWQYNHLGNAYLLLHLQKIVHGSFALVHLHLLAEHDDEEQEQRINSSTSAVHCWVK